ncbi:MAG: tRNA pseudouridine(55) synthase TruB [Candidatus Omnitrophica bacterium]|nr:tRNA pseudouridine(55) synthase TruB [Candidatus Omnitrophota bacterium]
MDINGLLLIDKPTGMTSHDVIDILRAKLEIRKIGHAGTLDPEATGLLLVLISKASTKKAGSFTGLDKTYEVRLTLGIRTDTADHTGKIISQQEVPGFSKEQIKEAFDGFLGVSKQIPPMVSAKKVGGKKLYALARKGISIKREPQSIKITSIDISKIELPHVYFTIRCSKGTYVRTICEDIGVILGCASHMNGLRRLGVGEYNVDDAIKVEDIKECAAADINSRIIKI